MMPEIHLCMLYAYAANIDRLSLGILYISAQNICIVFWTDFQYAQQAGAK